MAYEHSSVEKILRIFLRCEGNLNEIWKFFLHLYPEKTAMLPYERWKYGFANLDHQPWIHPSHWKKNWFYLDEIDLSNLKSGKYRVIFGLLNIDRKRISIPGVKNRAIEIGDIDVQ